MQELPKTIKHTDAVKRFEKGEMVVLAEYRRSNAERIKWRDSESQQVKEMNLLTHNVELGDSQPCAVNERVEDTFDHRSYVAPYKKGSRVCIFYTGVTLVKGSLKMSGTMVPVVEG